MSHWDTTKPIRVLKGEETVKRHKPLTPSLQPKQAAKTQSTSIRRHIVVRLTARVEVTEEYYLSLFHNPDRVMKTVWPNYVRQLCSLDILEESEPFDFKNQNLHEWKV